MVTPLWLMNIFGWIVMHKRLVLITLAGILLFALVVMAYRGCKSSPPKLDEAEIQKAEQAIKDRNDKELREILAASDAREAVIDSNVANAERDKIQNLHEARKKWANANISELQAEFERRSKE